MSSYPDFSGVRVDQSFSFCVVFSGQVLVFSFVCFALSVFQFFILRLMITPFVIVKHITLVRLEECKKMTTLSKKKYI